MYFLTWNHDERCHIFVSVSGYTIIFMLHAILIEPTYLLAVIDWPFNVLIIMYWMLRAQFFCRQCNLIYIR